MITLTREEAQQVLDALERCYDVIDWPADGETPQDDAAKLLRARLSAPEPEPVAWIGISETWGLPKMVVSEYKKDGYKPVYLAPPQREWQGLTEEDFVAVNQSCSTVLQAALCTESILKEKNR